MLAVVLKEVEKYPGKRFPISSLLPHLDVPHHVIVGNNTDLCRDCAFIPNLSVLLHKNIRIHHMRDDVHLNE